MGPRTASWWLAARHVPPRTGAPRPARHLPGSQPRDI